MARIIVWGTGNVGRHAIRALIDHPDHQIVGGYVSSPEKVGRDLGELARRDPIGITATGDVDAVLAMDADVVLHLPLASRQGALDPDRDQRDICRILTSGKHVITTVGYLYPKAYGGSVVAELEDACRIGDAVLHGTGANPGFMSELVPLVLSGLSRDITSITVSEHSVFDRYPSPQIIFDTMGFGLAPDDYERHTARYRAWLTGLFSESVLMVADGLGIELDEIAVDHEYRLSSGALRIAAGDIAAETIVAQKWSWSGVVDGRDAIRLDAVYKAVPLDEWTTPSWVCTIEGRPRIHLEQNEWISDGLLATAMHAIHAIGPVCAAPPGIRTFLDLPLIIGRHTLRR